MFYFMYLIVVGGPILVFGILAIVAKARLGRFLFVLSLVVIALFEVPLRIQEGLNSSRTAETLRIPKPYVVFGGKESGESRLGFWRAPGQFEIPVVRLNALGFRGEMPPWEKGDEFRVFVFGGSTVFNGARSEETIPGALGAEFRKKGFRKAKVYNFGMGSAVSGQELAYLVNIALDYKPDLVISYGGGNDIFNKFSNYDPRPGYPLNYFAYEMGIRVLSGDSSMDEAWIPLLRRSKALVRIFPASLAQLVPYRYQLKEQVGYRTERGEDEIIRKYESNLKKMCMMGKGFGYRFLGILQPIVHLKDELAKTEREALYGNDFSSYIHHMYGKAGAAIGRLKALETDFPCRFSDLSATFKKEKNQVFIDILHVFDIYTPRIAMEILKRFEDFPSEMTNTASSPN